MRNAPSWLCYGLFMLMGLSVGVSISQTRAAGSTLKMIVTTDLKVIDPFWTTAYTTRNYGYMIYDTLFTLDANLQPQPQMVDTWTVSPDGLTYTFTLRPGLQWHDGAPVRAADCVASLKRWGKRDGMGQMLLEVTKAFAVLDDRTFTLSLQEPYALVLPSLAKISSYVPFMMPERVANTDAFTQIKEHIGSGPFKFVTAEWIPGNKAIFVRNPDYIPRPEPATYASGGKVVKVERVEWFYIPDQATAQAALAAGEMDFFEGVQLDMFPLLESQPDITVAFTDPMELIVRFGHKHDKIKK